MDQTHRAPFLTDDSICTPRRKYKRYSKNYSTYLGLIAHVIQNSPNKMLTFGQLMESLSTFVSGERRGLENNVRVCLSSNSCFVKVPVNPEYPNARRNYWKVDESRITPKMLRRHFGGTLGILSALPLRCKTQPDAKENTMKSTEIPPLLDKRPVKFSSSFSIESLLRKDPETRSKNTPQDNASGDVKSLPNACVYSLNKKFGLSAFEPTASYRDFPESGIQSFSQCGRQTYHDLHDTMRNEYTHQSERLGKRARVSPPFSVLAGAGVAPYFDHENIMALKRWSLSMKTFDSRNF
ncbi:hypothetical protein ACEWY4_023848 [Coilia grayii]|uniref:Fork-head domain-containing protein n=1 Tax=Coilia grayii TaxID=363190 RepID=A0ABD1J1A3_9TELE